MAKPLIIYGRILSPFVARAVLAASAKGFKHKIVMPDDGIKTPAYLKMNPLGKIPVVKDGKTIVYESQVVVEYLEAKSKAKRLVPANAADAGKVRLVAAVAGEYLQPPAIKLFRYRRNPVAAPCDVDATLIDLNKGFDVFEHVLLKGKYAGGSKFSIADVYAAPALVFAMKVASLFAADLFAAGSVLASRPKTAKYWGAIQKDKLAKPVIAEMQAMMEEALAGKIPPLS